MRRWPLSTAALLFVLAAHLAVAPAGEPIEPGRPLQAVGTVTSEVRDFGFSKGTAYHLLVPPGISIPLLLGEAKQSEILDHLVSTGRRARLRGVWYKVNSRPFLLLDDIKELP